MDTTDFHRSLSSKKAFESLMREIGDIVKAKRPSHNFLTLVRRYLLGSSLRNVGSGVEPGWSHAIVMACGVVLIIVGTLTKNESQSLRTSRVVGEGCVLILVGIFNLVLCVREAYAQDVELMDRLSDLSAQYLDILHSHGGQKAWPFQSVDPTCNSSPPITLIHVYRDGVLGHIPANLLVELDLIQLAVGHIAPANIRCVEMGSQNVKYQRGETILPLPMAVDIAGDEDEIKCPNQTRQRFVVEETPIVSDILRFLERRANRPIPHLAVKLQVLSRYIQIALLVVFVSVELVNVCRYYTISDHSGAWSEMFLVLPIYTVLPMLPMSIPFLWYMMNAFGVAHILATYDMLLETDYAPQSGHKRHSDFGISAPQDNEIPVDDGWADEGEDSDSSLEESFDLESRSPTAQKHTSTFPATQRTEKVYVPRLFQVMRRVFQVWYGSAYATLPRSSSLFLEMGSITVVCTVDKEGVLSYPTPSVEKIFLPGSEVVAMDLLNVPEAKRDDITDADLDVTDNMEYSASEGRYTPSPDSRLPELARHPGLSPDESKTLGSNDILVNADTETNEHLKLSQSISVPANMALAKDPADRPALGRLPGSSFSAEHLRRFGSTSEQGKSVPKKHNDSRVGNGPMARVDMRVGVDSDMNESCEDECADEVVTPNVGMDGRWSPMTRGVGGEQETDTDMDVDGDVDVDRDGDRGRDLDVTERRIGGVTRSAGKVKMKESSGDRSTSVEGTGGATRLWGIWKGSGFVPEATDADGEAEETETDDAVGKKTKRGAKKSKKKWSRRQGDSSRDVTDRDSSKKNRGRSSSARRSLLSLLGRSPSQVRVSGDESTSTDPGRDIIEKSKTNATDSGGKRAWSGGKHRVVVSEMEVNRESNRNRDTDTQKMRYKDRNHRIPTRKGTYMRYTSLTDEHHGGPQSSNAIVTTRSAGYNRNGQFEHATLGGTGGDVLLKSYSSFGPSDDEDLARYSTLPADLSALESGSRRDLMSSVSAHTIVKSTHSFTHTSKSPRMRYRKQYSSVETTVSVIVPNRDAAQHQRNTYGSLTPQRRHRPRFYSADSGRSTPQSDLYFLPTLRRNRRERPESYTSITGGTTNSKVRDLSQSECDDSDDVDRSDGNGNGSSNALTIPRVKISFTNQPHERMKKFSPRVPASESHAVTATNANSSEFGMPDNTVEPKTMAILDPVLMDIAHDRRLKYGFKFTDADWQSRLPLLKPLGLNVLLNTNCHRPWLSMRHADMMRYITYVELNKVLTSRKRCLCLLAKTIGFADSALQKYRRRQQIWAFAKEVAHPEEHELKRTTPLESQDDRDRGEPVPSMISQLVEETDTGTFHLMSEGSAPLVLQTCTDYFDGNNVIKLTDADRRRILEFYQTMSTRMLVIAFSYRPIHRSHDWFNHNNPVAIAYSANPKKLSHGRLRNGQASQKEIRYKCRQMIEHQTFTGMVAVQRQARETVVKVVSHLDTAGIRFVFFSQQDSGSSTAFAETLGLPTGWNTSISLNENTTDTTTEGPSQLPRGIQNIRPHLKNVDDVPLLIQLFTDCTVEATGEMISIMQEHGEVVCCIGSSLRSQNMLLFSQADISIGIEPLAPKNCLNIDSSRLFTSTPKTPAAGIPGSQAADLANATLNTIQTMMQTVRFYQEADVPVLALSAELNNIGCSLAIGKQTNLYVVMHLIASARYCLMNAHKIFFFVIGSNLAISLLMVLNALFLFPPVLTGVDILWLTLIQFPLATIPIWGSRVGSVMHLMPDKNNRVLKDVSRHLIHGAMRFGPTSAVVLAVFACCLFGLCESVLLDGGLTSACTYYGPANVSAGRNWTGWGTSYTKGLRTAQLVCCTMLAVYAIPLSATFLHRTLPVWKCKLHTQYLWMAVSVLILVLQFLYVLVSDTIDKDSKPNYGWSNIPWYAYVIAVIWIPILVLLNEGAKMIYKKRFTLLQKRARLLFDTKLGMHSPV